MKCEKCGRELDGWEQEEHDEWRKRNPDEEDVVTCYPCAFNDM